MSAKILAQLIAQGSAGGADLATLRAIAEEAGDLAATRALTRLGLADDAATRDVAELRALLGAWRDAKRSAWKAIAGWLAVVLLTAIAVKFGFGQWVK